MQRVHLDDVDQAVTAATVKRSLSRVLETSDMALNHYELEPGKSLSFGYHSHADQEEVFYVEEGSVEFETDAGTVTVGAGEIAYSPPGEYKRGTNLGKTRARVLAIGAPREMGETDIQRECPSCGEYTSQELGAPDGSDVPPAELQTSDSVELVARCLECGTETGRFH